MDGVRSETGVPALGFAQLDTTTLTNGSYQLRAVGLDADVDDEVTGFSPNFTVANQVPVITAFTVLNPGAGNGTSSNDRWWFATPANGTLQFRWGASDDDLERATLSNVPARAIRPPMDREPWPMDGTGRRVI